VQDAASKAKEINKQSAKKPVAATRLSMVGGFSSVGAATGSLAGPSAKYSAPRSASSKSNFHSTFFLSTANAVAVDIDDLVLIG
jgi:hypothetical protein